MKKQHQAVHVFRRPGIVATISVIGCLMAALAFMGGILVYQVTMSSEDSFAKQEMNIMTDHAQLKFCYDNDIKPCDDTAIDAFNALPENQASGNQFHAFRY